MYFVLLCILYGLLTVWIIRFIYLFYNKLDPMVGMMAAMAIGMTSGLAMGSLLASWLPNQFFHTTLIGIAFGGAAGIFAGFPISLMAVIDGLLSGVMGGMMGTMLMVMVPVNAVEITINILSVLCSGIIFLLFIMLLGAVNPDYLRERSFVMSKPVMMFSVIVFVLIVVQASSLYESYYSQPDESSGHINHYHSSR